MYHLSVKRSMGSPKRRWVDNLERDDRVLGFEQAGMEVNDVAALGCDFVSYLASIFDVMKVLL